MSKLPSDFYGIDESIANEYLESLNDHIRFVQEAGRKMGMNEAQLAIHDASKFTEAEFPAYAMHFKGGGAPEEFSKAWLHHIHYNPHHWQHWIFPGGFTPKGTTVENGAVDMPGHYIIEMIADWRGANMAYKGTDDMQPWLWDNMPRITLHSKAAQSLRGMLDALGYADVVWGRKFAHELDED